MFFEHWGLCFFCLCVGLALLSRLLVTKNPGGMHLDEGTEHQILVVVMRGLAGKSSPAELERLARLAYPKADVLVSTVQPTPFANIDPYRLANIVEQGIHEAYSKSHYEKIVLLGYSLGAVVLRKALVWGNGIEDDRARFGVMGKRAWVDRVDRFVSLAGINRGWSIDPRPRRMSFLTYIVYYAAEKWARLTGTGLLMLSSQRGAPFIADLRVQWIRLVKDSRRPGDPNQLPFVVHLLGDIDDIVAREDSQDVAIASDSGFITLTNTDHKSITATSGTDADSQHRLEIILQAMTGSRDELPLERNPLSTQDSSVKRIVYVYHGIRDRGLWGDKIRDRVKELTPGPSDFAVIPAKYGFFPMLPFLLYWDRQKNVRSFMDDYTENLTAYPSAEQFDFIGHSNGTYILASALQRYSTIRVRNVFFAGSVVPSAYPWQALISSKRVSEVKNIVASADWVVAYFPRFFEQIAEWMGKKPNDGFLDLGSGGFRGFQAASNPNGCVQNIEWVMGGHSAGVDTKSRQKLDALADYATTSRAENLSVFKNADAQSPTIDRLSNVCWLVWLVILTVLIALGIAISHFSTIGLVVYALVIVGLLNSI